jgi:hypothetical protein
MFLAFHYFIHFHQVFGPPLALTLVTKIPVYLRVAVLNVTEEIKMKLLLMQLILLGTVGGFAATDTANAASQKMPDMCSKFSFPGKCGLSAADLRSAGLNPKIDYDGDKLVFDGVIKKGCQDNVLLEPHINNKTGDINVFVAFVDGDSLLSVDQFKSKCTEGLAQSEKINMANVKGEALYDRNGLVNISQFDVTSYSSPLSNDEVGKSPARVLQDEINRNNLLSSLEDKCNKRKGSFAQYDEYLSTLQEVEAMDGRNYSQTAFRLNDELDEVEANEKAKLLTDEIAEIQAALADISNSGDESASSFEKLMRIRDQILALDNDAPVNGKGGHGLAAIPHIKTLLDNDDSRESSLTHALDEIMFDDGEMAEFVTKEHIEEFKSTVELASRLTESKSRKAHLKAVAKRAKSAVKTKEAEEKYESLEERQELIQELHAAGEYKEARKMQRKLDSDYMEVVYGIKRTCKLGIFCSTRRVGPGLAGAQGGMPGMPGMPQTMNPMGTNPMAMYQQMGMSPWGMQQTMPWGNQQSIWGHQGMWGRQPGSIWGM